MQSIWWDSSDQERSFSITLVEFLHCGGFSWCQAGFQMKGSDEERTARFQTAAPLYPLSVSIQVSGLRSTAESSGCRRTTCIQITTPTLLVSNAPRPESSIDEETYVSTFLSHSGDDGGISVCVVSLRTYFWIHLQTSRRCESRQGLSSPLVPVHTVERFVVLRKFGPLSVGFLLSASLSSCNLATSLFVPSASCFPLCWCL